MNQYLTHNHSVGANMWHIQFCTKYRYKMFKQYKYKNLCEIAIMEVCKRHNLQLKALNVQEDHIHLIVDIPKNMTATKAVQLIKGFSSYFLFKLVPNFRLRYSKGHLWSKGYFATTVGFANLDNTMEYVNNQELHHQ